MKTFMLTACALMLMCFLSCRAGSTSIEPSSSSKSAQAQTHAQPATPPQQIVLEPKQKTEAVAPAVTMLPVDEGFNDASFEKFRNRLLAAAKRRDTQFILSVLDEQVRLGGGGHRGVADFREQWRPEQKNSRLWQELTDILSLGGSFETSQGETRFCAPYVTSRWRYIVEEFPDHSDAYTYAAVVKKNVKVRSKPSADAPVLTTLSFNVVKVNYDDSVNDESQEDGFKWVKIDLPAAGHGYVSGDDVRSPIDYSACFKKTGGRWVMVSFAAGD